MTDPTLFPEPERIDQWRRLMESGKLGKWTRRPKGKGGKNKETEFSRIVMRILESLGAWVWRWNSGKVQMPGGAWIMLAPKGTPDMGGEFNGRPLAVEVKLDDTALRADQAEWGRKAIRREWLYCIVRPKTVHQLQELLTTGEIQKETLAELDAVG